MTPKILALLMVTLSLSACLKRPDFMIRTDEATVPLADAGRADIAARVAELEQGIAAGSYRGNALKEANLELAQLRTRLTEGDFRVGDELIVTVTRETINTDTATIRDGLQLSFAALPDVSVAGVLRSELQTKLQAHVDRYLVDHVVRVNLLTRLQMMGQIGRPGFYSISPDRPVSELIMLAGGPTATTNLEDVNIRRNGRLIVKPSMWKQALNNGTTVAQLGLQPGDVVEVGGRARRDWQSILRIAAITVSSLFALLRLLQFIYAEPE